jgi:hypothetical protein
MPDVQGNQIDVSREEERYLRRVFHRFAAPYVVMGVMFGALLVAAPGWIATDTEPAPEQVADPRVREEIAALHSDLAALSQRAVAAESALARTKERLVALEGRSGDSGETSLDPEEFTRRIDASLSRIEALEQRVAGGAGAPVADASRLEERMASLGGRVARLEGELRAERSETPPAYQAH